MKDHYDVVVIGAGTAGLGAAQRLIDAKRDVLIVEARDRIGGRAYTLPGTSYDLGCEWLHSGDVNPWTTLAERRGFTVYRRPPSWSRQSRSAMSAEEQDAFWKGFAAFEAGVEAAGARTPDTSMAASLDPTFEWTPLIEAIGTYITGGEMAEVSAADYARYRDTGVDWQINEGYGRVIADFGAQLLLALETQALRVDHSGARVRIETTRGVIEANAVIVTLPTPLIADGALRFTPDLPEHRDAAAALPLGMATKVFLAPARVEDFPVDGHVFGDVHARTTGSYYLRPLQKPAIAGYFGGDQARALDAGGEAATFDAAIEELVGVFGSALRTQLTPIIASRWQADPFARGAYSYAKVGAADARAVLAQDVDGRIFFAGEACHARFFSTAHGAYETGVAAAERILAAR